MVLVLGMHPNMWGRVWHHTAHSPSLAGPMGVFLCHFWAISRIFNRSVLVTHHTWCTSPGTYIFRDVTSFWHDDITNDVIICMCSRSHDLLGIKGATHSGGWFCYQDLLGFRLFEVCTGSDASGASL